MVGASRAVATARAAGTLSGTATGQSIHGRTVALVQAALCLFTGIWPLVSIRTFEMVTGEKTDDWLVKTVGVLVTVIGAVLAAAALRARLTREIALLGMGSALMLTVIDVTYVAAGVIGPIYLADAVAETLLVACWVPVLRRLP
jgi:hypothetical protein